jgi:tetratricopeptide (TPR) repeat protein
LGFVLVIAGFGIYWNTLPAPFTFDDDHAIVINEQIRHLSTSLSPTEQGSPLAGRPLVSVSFAINYALGGLNVRGYRLVNIAIHVLCALLLLAIAARTFQVREASLKGSPRTDWPSTNLAFAIALIWMVHPLVTEAVNYVSQRTELMMAAFFLLTLYTSQRAVPLSAAVRLKPDTTDVNQSKTWLALSVVCCAMGMACKETMAVAPLVVFLYDRTFVFGSFRETLRRRWPYYAGLCATWLVLVALLWSSPRGNSAGFAGASVSPWEYLLNQSVMIVRYLRLAVWPRGLVLDYGEPVPLTFSDVAPYAVAVTALLAATIIALVRRPAFGFPGAWFFLTLAPTSSLVPISTEVGAERRMYLPLMAIVVLVLTTAARAFRSSESATAADLKGPRRMAMSCTVVIAAVLSVATFQRNAEYLSGLTLWQSVLDRWTPHARAHRNLAAELKLAGRPDEELTHLRAAVEDLPEIRNLLGLELLSAGKIDEGVDALTRFIRERPSDPNVSDARAALGAALLGRKDYERARFEYTELVKVRPNDADALSNLGIALASLGRNDEATHAFERAVDVDPRNGLSQRNLALHLFQLDDFDGAVRHAREAVTLTPNDPPAHNLLGLALIGQQKTDEAIDEFRASLALQPENNDAAGYLQRTLKAAGR